MSEFKFTDGPWVVGGPNDASQASIGVRTESNWVICDMCNDLEDVYGDVISGSEIANARLIAASPKLAALAKRIASLNPDNPEIGSGMLRQIHDEATSLIGEITGESA